MLLLRASLLCTLLLWTVTAAADTVFLRNGQTYEGQITAESELSVSISSNGAVWTFAHDKIDHLTHGKVAAAPKASKTVVRKEDATGTSKALLYWFKPMKENSSVRLFRSYLRSKAITIEERDFSQDRFRQELLQKYHVPAWILDDAKTSSRYLPIVVVRDRYVAGRFEPASLDALLSGQRTPMAVTLTNAKDQVLMYVKPAGGRERSAEATNERLTRSFLRSKNVTFKELRITDPAVGDAVRTRPGVPEPFLDRNPPLDLLPLVYIRGQYIFGQFDAATLEAALRGQPVQ